MYQNLPQQNQMNPYYNPYMNQQPQYRAPMMPTPMDTNQVVAPTTTNSNYLKGWPVTSIEQARAARIDLDGSPFLFTDYGHGKIYMKQINMDGTAALRTFSLTDDTTPQQPEFITREQFQNTIIELRNSLMQQTAPTVQPQPQTKPKVSF